MSELYGKAGISAFADVEGGGDDIIRIEKVQKTYLLGMEGIPALRGVSMSIRRGEFVIIFGTSGGGKTSLLNIMGTIDKPTKGEIYVNNTRITHRTTDKTLSRIRLNDIGFVFQTFNLLGSMTAMENVMMPMVLKGTLSKAERQARAKELLERVGMGHRLDHYPSMLSGGEQQRVTVARAVANRPSILLLDEPTGDLDSKNGDIVMQQLVELNEEGITLVMVTHDVNLKAYANRVLWMRDGKLQREEVNSAAVREAALQELRSDVAEIVPEMGKAAVPAEFTNTSMRHPSDYETMRNVRSDAGLAAINQRLALYNHEDPGMNTREGRPLSHIRAIIGDDEFNAPQSNLKLPPIEREGTGAGVFVDAAEFTPPSSEGSTETEDWDTSSAPPLDVEPSLLGNEAAGAQQYADHQERFIRSEQQKGRDDDAWASMEK